MRSCTWIVSAAEETVADPIVLSSEGGKSRMEYALLVSVSEEVLRHANRTVLVVGGYLESESPKVEYQRKEKP